MEEGGGENQVKREGGADGAMSIKVKDQNGGEVRVAGRRCASLGCYAAAVAAARTLERRRRLLLRAVSPRPLRRCVVAPAPRLTCAAPPLPLRWCSG